MKSRTHKSKTSTEKFEVMIDGKPVTVTATLYETHNSEARYRVSVDGSPIHIFAWDPQLNRLAQIDQASVADQIPAKVEEAIGRQLYSRAAA